eukprot:1190663-Pleurochrysis_carterae.AAC.5
MREIQAKLEEKRTAEAAELHSLRTKVGMLNRNSVRSPAASGDAVGLVAAVRQLQQQLDEEQAQRGAAATTTAKMQEEMRRLEIDAAGEVARVFASRAAARGGGAHLSFAHWRGRDLRATRARMRCTAEFQAPLRSSLLVKRLSDMVARFCSITDFIT